MLVFPRLALQRRQGLVNPGDDIFIEVQRQLAAGMPEVLDVGNRCDNHACSVRNIIAGK